MLGCCPLGCCSSVTATPQHLQNPPSSNVLLPCSSSRPTTVLFASPGLPAGREGSCLLLPRAEISSLLGGEGADGFFLLL